MTGSTFVLLSGALTFGVPLALAVNELVALRRRPDGEWRRDPEPAPLPPKPLPDCLIPRPMAPRSMEQRPTAPIPDARAPVLENA